MNEISSRIASLSPEQLARLAYELKASKKNKVRQIPTRTEGESWRALVFAAAPVVPGSARSRQCCLSRHFNPSSVRTAQPGGTKAGVQ